MLLSFPLSSGSEHAIVGKEGRKKFMKQQNEGKFGLRKKDLSITVIIMPIIYIIYNANYTHTHTHTHIYIYICPPSIYMWRKGKQTLPFNSVLIKFYSVTYFPKEKSQSLYNKYYS